MPFFMVHCWLLVHKSNQHCILGQCLHPVAHCFCLYKVMDIDITIQLKLQVGQPPYHCMYYNTSLENVSHLTGHNFHGLNFISGVGCLVSLIFYALYRFLCEIIVCFPFGYILQLLNLSCQVLAYYRMTFLNLCVEWSYILLVPSYWLTTE